MKISVAQCVGFPATVAADDCASHPSLTNNSSVEIGQTRSICSYDDVILNFTTINLNGGIIRVCGDATISGTWNSGTIVVECGATLFFPNGIILNTNAGIVNYGTVNVTGDLNLQNSNTYFYNELDSSRLLVSGNLVTGQNISDIGYVKNNGFISVDGTVAARQGGYFCLGPDSDIVCQDFVYMVNCGGPSNRFTRSGTGNNAVVRYSNSASLRATLTSSSAIELWSQTGASLNLGGCGSIGSATFVANAPSIPNQPEPDLSYCPTPNCRTIVILPVEFGDFSVTQDNTSVMASWETFSERNNDYFDVMRSTDGYNWESIGTVKGKGNSTSIQEYSFIDRSPLNGISYYRIDQYDFNKESLSTPIQSVSRDENGIERIELFPNPAKDIITVQVPEGVKELHIVSVTGALIKTFPILSEFRSEISIDIRDLPNGTYFMSSNQGAMIFTKVSY